MGNVRVQQQSKGGTLTYLRHRKRTRLLPVGKWQLNRQCLAEHHSESRNLQLSQYRCLHQKQQQLSTHVNPLAYSQGLSQINLCSLKNLAWAHTQTQITHNNIGDVTRAEMATLLCNARVLPTLANTGCPLSEYATHLQLNLGMLLQLQWA